jgi:hypothetical protein
MKKANLSAAVTAAAIALSALPAHAVVSCAVAGQYDGKYDGADDHGLVRVVVAPDGTLTGEAQSQVNGATLAVGGVVAGDGTLSTDGAVQSGARFDGRFFGNQAGGMWGKAVMIEGTQHILAGTWGVQRTAPAAGCQ